MTFSCSASGRACVNEWKGPIVIADLLNLLLALWRTAASDEKTLAIIIFRETVPLPPNFLLNCLQGALPVILDCCEQLIVVIEGSSTDREPLRTVFQRVTQGTARPSPALFDSMDAAFTHALQFAPEDLFELSRHSHRSERSE